MTMLPFEDITVSRQVQVLVQSLQLPATTLEWILCWWLQSLLLLWWPNKWKYFCCNILCHFSRKLGNKTIRWDIFWSGKYTTWDNTPLEQHLFNTLNTLHILNTKGEASSSEFSVAEPLLNDLKKIYHNRSTFSELLPPEHPIENCVCVCSGHKVQVKLTDQVHN